MTNDNDLDYVLRARTLRAMGAADFVCDLLVIKVALIIFMTIVYLILAWLRALGWWLEIGCSARSLPALYAESLGAGAGSDLAAMVVLCVVVMPAIVIVTKSRRVRS